MTTSHGRRIQGRRALAIMAWVSLVIIAGLLWYGQEEDLIRIQAWEPAALLLSAYSAFLAIFGWLLFAPERKSAEESPALFFSGMLTLIPPCFIAYHLMPPSSPLRGWLTLGVFVFGLLAILSPLPAEVFAVPRDRKSYLQPLTDSYLSVIDVEDRQLDLQSLVPRSWYTLTTPEVARSPTTPGSTARDPWTDPFYGTGRAMSEVGSARRSAYSESRSRGSDQRSELASLPDSGVRESGVRESGRDAAYRDERFRDSERRDRTQEEERDRPLPQSRERQRVSGLGYPVPRTSVPPVPPMPPAIPPDPAIPKSSGSSGPSMIARSAFAPRESRTPDYQPPSAAPVHNTPGSGLPATVQPTSTIPTLDSTTATRRPLTEPGTRTAPPVGFQIPPALRPITTSPPPVPSYLAAETDLHELDRRIRELEADDEQDEDSAGDSVVQSAISSTARTSALSNVKMDRLKDDLGGETIDGTIRVFFEVGQKRAHLHVPFSPPLAGLPEVECEAVGEDSVRCKVAVRQPYGIRIEARRSDASHALHTDIGFAAVYTPSARRG